MGEEADGLVDVKCHERFADGEIYRIAYWKCRLTITCVEVTIHMSRLSCMRFAATIIERQRRPETSAEESMFVIRLLGVLIWMVEIVSESLRSSHCCPNTTK